MAKRKVIIELPYTESIAEAAFFAASNPQAGLDVTAVPEIAGVELDASFAATPLPARRERPQSDSPYDTAPLLEFVTGVVAAVRSILPFHARNPASHPAAVRTLLTSTAEDLGPAGYDFLCGYGVVTALPCTASFAHPSLSTCVGDFPGYADGDTWSK